jgi:hypothetical protein
MTVLREELPQIRDACRRVAPGYSPKLSIAIAGKRYILRFKSDQKTIFLIYSTQTSYKVLPCG